MRIRHFLLFLSCLAALAIGDRIDKRAIKSNPKVSKKSEIVEGSGLPPKIGPGAPSDLEIHGSGAPGYSSDDEDGDEVHGSGVPPTERVEGSGRPPPPPAVIARPQQTTSTTTTTHAPPLVTGTRSTTTTHAVFNPVERLPDPVVHVEEKDRDTVITEIREPPPRPEETTQGVAPPTTTTRRTPAAVPPAATPAEDDAQTPFSPIPRPGIIAAIIGGGLIGVITAVMLVMFIVFRMRKKDEGSYALDEPKPRPYSSYQYTKASTKEFYA